MEGRAVTRVEILMDASAQDFEDFNEMRSREARAASV